MLNALQKRTDGIKKLSDVPAIVPIKPKIFPISSTTIESQISMAYRTNVAR